MNRRSDTSVGAVFARTRPKLLETPMSTRVETAVGGCAVADGKRSRRLHLAFGEGTKSAARRASR